MKIICAILDHLGTIKQIRPGRYVIECIRCHAKEVWRKLEPHPDWKLTRNPLISPAIVCDTSVILNSFFVIVCWGLAIGVVLFVAVRKWIN